MKGKKMINWDNRLSKKYAIGRCRRCGHGWVKPKGEDKYCEDCSIKLVDEDIKLKQK